ncbi:MAG: peptide chain release factor N(5)-glutamine methyltransferase, partial [Clostridia bacterium]|nr:peptide chain release factor N(5)-glutamine methyltransferase [Clostridia bacterium]
MKVSELHSQIVGILEAGGCETPAFDAVCLLEDIADIGRGKVREYWQDTVPDVPTQAALAAARRRAAGEPLQYILGTWDFLNLTLCVGEGVLIPRPETELLCETVAEYLRHKPRKNVWDLCAGSGCVGLGIAALEPKANVTAYEFSDKAFTYLQENIRRYSHYAVTAVKADVLNDYDRFTDPVDVIVSNPPYIPSADLDGLQREVQYEPRMALDGGDGYRFYRTIADHWLPKLSPDGLVA